MPVRLTSFFMAVLAAFFAVTALPTAAEIILSVSARSAALISAADGKILFEKNAGPD